jgi:hypothetical protein
MRDRTEPPKRPPADDQRRSRREAGVFLAIVVLPAVVLILAGFLGAVPGYRTGGPPQAGSRARSSQPVQTTIAPPPAPERPSIKLKAVSQLETTIPFGTARGPVSRRILFHASGPITQPRTRIQLYATDLLRQGADGRIPDRNLTYRWEARGSLVAIRLCVSPTHVGPGEYRGTLYVEDPRFAETTIPVSVTLRYGGWHLILAGLWFAFLAAGLFKWAGAVRAVGGTTSLARLPGDFGSWCAARFLGLGGAVVAIAALFWSQYWNDPSWGSSPEQFFALMGAAFAVAVTRERAVVHLASRRRTR